MSTTLVRPTSLVFSEYAVRATLYCSCGDASPIDTYDFTDETSRNAFFKEVAYQIYEYKETVPCPSCGNRLHRMLYDYGPTYIVDSSSISEEGSNISLNILYSKCAYVNGLIERSKGLLTLSFDIVTNEIVYVLDGKTLRTRFSKGMEKLEYRRYRRRLRKSDENPRKEMDKKNYILNDAYEDVIDYLQVVAARKGIQYVDVTRFIEGREIEVRTPMEYRFSNSVDYALFMLKFPVLGEFPFKLGFIPRKWHRNFEILDGIENFYRYVFGSKSKKLRHLAENADNALLWFVLSKSGLPIDHVIRMIESGKSMGTSTPASEILASMNKFYYRNDCRQICEFLNEHFERNAVARLFLTSSNTFSQDLDDLRDVVHQLGDLLTHVPGYKPKMGRDLQTFHDRVSHDYVRLVDQANFQFNYAPEQRALEGEVEGLSYFLPEDYDTLKEHATALDNCATSYWREILNKRTTVLFARELRDSSLLLCLEIQRGKVVQVKEIHNQEPSIENRKHVLAWASSKGLSVRTSDLELN